MSVRKSTLRTAGGQSTGMNLLRNVGFWAFMLVGSFLIGFLIISPLINVASGSRSENKPAPTVTTAPPPSPENGTSGVSAQPENRRRDNESPVEILPDRSERTGDVQEPSSVDPDGSGRRSERTDSEENPQERTRDESPTGEQRDDTGETRLVEPTDRTDATDGGERETRRGRRRSRSSTDASEAGTRTREPADTGVQRGEGIDR
jgi:hypothetical protein